MRQSVIGGITTNTFTYNANGQVLTNIDGNGNMTVNAYDPTTGTLLSTTDALTNVTSYTYNSVGQVTSSVDPLGNVTSNYYAGGNLTSNLVYDVSNTIL